MGLVILDRRYGLTTIELIIVLAIVIVLSVVATAKFSGFYTLRLDSAANRLLSDIVYTRQLSITTQTRFGVRFNITDNGYTVYNDATGAPIQDPLDPSKKFIVDFDNLTEYSGVKLTDINFGGGSDGVLFDIFGVPLSNSRRRPLESEGKAVLTYKTQSRTIYVTPNTGNTGIR